MSTPANNPPSDTVNIEIDGKPCKARVAAGDVVIAKPAGVKPGARVRPASG